MVILNSYDWDLASRVLKQCPDVGWVGDLWPNHIFPGQA